MDSHLSPLQFTNHAIESFVGSYEAPTVCQALSPGNIAVNSQMGFLYSWSV